MYPPVPGTFDMDVCMCRLVSVETRLCMVPKYNDSTPPDYHRGNNDGNSKPPWRLVLISSFSTIRSYLGERGADKVVYRSHTGIKSLAVTDAHGRYNETGRNAASHERTWE